MASTPVHWSYKGTTGPTEWSNLDETFDVCRLGKHQSPIDIVPSNHLAVGDTQALQLNYKASQLKLLNNGHTLQLPYDAGSTISLEGKEYQLVQFHFHVPSEHTIAGQSYALEVHLVHLLQDNQLLVVGVMFTEGSENSFLAEFWSRIPVLEGLVEVAGATINIAALVPNIADYYRYEGSLTTPPCSENVHWIVLKAELEASKAQINKFLAIFGQNARPVQSLNGRVVSEVTTN